MSYKNNRNSREDKSLKNKHFEGSSNKEQPEKSNTEKKKLFGEGQDKPFKSRSGSSEYRKKTDNSSEGTEGKRRSSGSSDRKPYDGREGSKRSSGEGSERKPYGSREGGKRPSSGSFERKPYDSREGGKKSFGEGSERKSYNDREGGKRSSGGSFERKPFENREGGKRSFGEGSERKEGEGRKRISGGSFERKPFEKRSSGEGSERKSYSDKAGSKRPSGGSFERKPFEGKKYGEKKEFERPYEKKFEARKPFDRNEKREWTHEERVAPATRSRQNGPSSKEPELIRLNRYIANAGICSRRKADELIEAGVVSVNGEVVNELGFKVNPSKDVIRYNGETLKREKMVYVLLNKPKDFITTTDDPQERRTVMQLVEKASRERIYPVGRLDRNTTGLLLMTNDGDLAEKLSHPRNNITKMYHIELNKSLSQGDFNKIEFGLELEDGLIKPDSLSYVQGASKREIGIQIHSGKNRIVRRIFEHLGYEVVKLDRVVYANLTKKDLPRGKWRFLEEKEIIQLKHFMK